MQEQKTKADEEARGGPYLTPARAFLTTFALVSFCLGLWFVLGRAPAADEIPERDQPTTFTLTEADAVAIFEDLKTARDRAYRHRDPTLIDEVYIPGSAISRRTHSEIDKLLKDNVLDRSRHATQSVQVNALTRSEIEITETVRVTPRFETETGRDVTSEESSKVEQQVRWTLRHHESQWLVADILIIESERL